MGQPESSWQMPTRTENSQLLPPTTGGKLLERPYLLRGVQTRTIESHNGLIRDTQVQPDSPRLLSEIPFLSGSARDQAVYQPPAVESRSLEHPVAPHAYMGAPKRINGGATSQNVKCV